MYPCTYTPKRMSLTRKQLYCNLLNRQFDTVLHQLRTTPTDALDYNFLQLYLAQSCRWGHVASLDFIWYKYVMRHHVLIIRPAQLCQISSIALSSGKNFMPEQIFYYFKKMYGRKFERGGVPINDGAMSQYALWEYELSRLRFESFVKGVGEKNGFVSKWKVFVKDMDNELPVSTRFSVRDFPYLIGSLGRDPEADESFVTNLLFSSGDHHNHNYKIRNPSTFVLLLNIVLLQPQFTRQFKLDLFYRFFETRRSLNYDDTFTILFKLFKGDGYQLTKLAALARDQNNSGADSINNLSALATRHLLEGLKGTKFEQESYRMTG